MTTSSDESTETDITPQGLAARGVPERIWADEDTWLSGPVKTRRAKEYVRADVVAALIREAEARGMAQAMALPAYDSDGDPSGPFDHKVFVKIDAIRAAAAALRKDEEPK
jgi:hypothetical protein